MSTSTESRDASSSLYRIELLREDNWLPWKCRITGIMRDRRLLKYADGSEGKPALSVPPKKEETEELAKWIENDARAPTQIELTLSDPQMIHIAGAKTAVEMWTQLRTMKEARGKMGIISARRWLYRTG
jgi:hypothetical protein